MTHRELRDQLYASFKHRAMLYFHIYDELQAEVGAERAAEILRRAIERRGREVGQAFAQYAPNDLNGLCQAFLAGIPDSGHMFSPHIERDDEQQLEITLRACPLRDAWQEAGLDDEQVATMCHIAAAIDTGTFEGAGFGFAAKTWQPGSDGCCHLQITPNPSASR